MVERFLKYSVFIPAPKECPVEDMARLFLKHVVKYGGCHIVSSFIETRFTEWLWTEFFKFLGSNLNLSTSFHPQTDIVTPIFLSDIF